MPLEHTPSCGLEVKHHRDQYIFYVTKDVRYHIAKLYMIKLVHKHTTLDKHTTLHKLTSKMKSSIKYCTPLPNMPQQLHICTLMATAHVVSCRSIVWYFWSICQKLQTDIWCVFWIRCHVEQVEKIIRIVLCTVRVLSAAKGWNWILSCTILRAAWILRERWVKTTGTYKWSLW